MKQKIVTSSLKILIVVLLVSLYIPVNAQTTLNGEYVLVINTSPTDNQSTGTITFDPTNNFKSASIPNSKYLEEYQQENSSGPFLGSPAATSYIVGDTKTVKTIEYTCIGIGTYCYVWMDNATLLEYNALSQTTNAATELIDLYDTESYPILQQLGADSYMVYADGSGKISILVHELTVAGYFSSSETYPINGSITAIHINKKDATSYSPGSYGGYIGLLAHEGQHALSYSTSKFTKWINEGMSLVAMDISTKGTDGHGWLNIINSSDSIRLGGPLVHNSYLNNTALDYSLPFAFLRYLNTQVNSGYDYTSNFFNKFYDNNRPIGEADSTLVKRVLSQYPNTQTWDFATSMINFRIACVKQSFSGPHGFYGDPVIASKMSGYPIYNGASGNPIILRPSGAIVIKTVNDEFTTPLDCGSNIQFIAFNVTNEASPLHLIGAGTEADPYLISHIAHLEFLDKTDYTDKYFRLSNHIDLNGFELSVDSFHGVLDGDNYKIYNMNNSYIKTNYGTIKNLNIGLDVVTSRHFALVSTNNGIISDCSVTGTIQMGSTTEYPYIVRVAGLAGINNVGGSIIRCSSNIDINGELQGKWPYIAGICARNEGGTITDCYAAGSINLTASPYLVTTVKAGGIAAHIVGTSNSNLYSVMEISISQPAVDTPTMYAGRIAGYISAIPASNTFFSLEGFNCYGNYSTYNLTGSKTDAELQLSSTFNNFDFSSTWTIPSSGTYLYPLFPREQNIPLSDNTTNKISDVKIWAINKSIIVDNCIGESIWIYNTSGVLVTSETVINQLQTFNVPSSGIYIVKLKNTEKKLLIK